MANTTLVGPGAGITPTEKQEEEEVEKGGEQEGAEESDEEIILEVESTRRKKWKALATNTKALANNTKVLANNTRVKTKGVLLGVAKGMKEGLLSTSIETGMRIEEEVLRTAYMHPLSK
jgi:hypothetical protein